MMVGKARLADARVVFYPEVIHKETRMADNKSPKPRSTEIILAWVGMAGAVALLWWLVVE
jgi:hypothetical protein